MGRSGEEDTVSLSLIHIYIKKPQNFPGTHLPHHLKCLTCWPKLCDKATPGCTSVSEYKLHKCRYTVIITHPVFVPQNLIFSIHHDCACRSDTFYSIRSIVYHELLLIYPPVKRHLGCVLALVSSRSQPWDKDARTSHLSGRWFQ